MDGSGVTFANELGEFLEPVLLWLRSIYFFEWYVYVPLMTAVSLGLYSRIFTRLKQNGTFSGCRSKQKLLWVCAYYGLCFLITNSLAVSLKTLIIEELDYSTRVWYEGLVGPLHFYIFTVALFYLFLVLRNRHERLDQLLGVYVQLGLIGGYWVCGFRILNEPISIFNPTLGLSGILLGGYFCLYNYDIYRRCVLKLM